MPYAVVPQVPAVNLDFKKAPVENPIQHMTPTLPPALSMYAITDIERSMITELKKRLQAKLSSRYDDIRICRFLRREKTLDQTEAIIRREMSWREQVRPDIIFEQFPKNRYFKSLVKYWPGTLHGVDRFGVPLYCERLGQIDLSSLLGKVPSEVLIQFHIYVMERHDRIIMQAFQRLGAPVGYVYIMDLYGLSIRHYTPSSIDILRQIQFIDDNYYPEFLRKVLVLNTSPVFYMFWKLAKVVMHKQSIAKFTVMSKDYKEELLKIATEENIPRWLGGKCNTCDHHNNDCKFGGDKFVLLN